MSLHTGGRAMGATSTRSRSTSAANWSARSRGTMPTCSPSGPTTRTSRARIPSLPRGPTVVAPPRGSLSGRPPRGEALLGGRDALPGGGEQGPDPVGGPAGPLAVGGLHGEYGHRVVVLEVQDRPRLARLEAQATDHLPGQVVRADQVAAPDAPRVGLHPRPGEHEDDAGADQPERDDRDPVGRPEDPAPAGRSRGADMPDVGTAHREAQPGEHHHDHDGEDPGDQPGPSRPGPHDGAHLPTPGPGYG